MKRTLASISFSEYPKLQVVEIHSFKVIDVNPIGQSAPNANFNVQID